MPSERNVATDYDRVPYPGAAHRETHPDTLATRALLHGLQPPEVTACRVLELGCGQGDNLIPMAFSLPDAELVGLDASPRQIATAREAAARLGVANIRFEAGDFCKFDVGSASFDYVIAHGVYSWVDAVVRDGLLDVCRRALSPQGVAYVSYNTYPGWRLKEIRREMALYDLKGNTEFPQSTRQVGQLLELLAAHVPENLKLYHQLIAVERDRWNMKDAAYLYHDDLEAVNHPVYFHQFADHALTQGLQYVCDAAVTPSVIDSQATLAAALSVRIGDDVVRREQYEDFLVGRSFRRSLLCHQDQTVSREIDAERLAVFSVSGWLTPTSAEPPSAAGTPLEFRGREGQCVSVDEPIAQAAMLELVENWPAAVSFQQLYVAARERLLSPMGDSSEATGEAQRKILIQNLWRAYQQGLVDLHVNPPAALSQISEYPTASPWARLQAEGKANSVTNLRMEMVGLNTMALRLLKYLDGRHSEEDLVDRCVQLLADEGIAVQKGGRRITEQSELREAARQGVRVELRRIARSALLMG